MLSAAGPTAPGALRRLFLCETVGGARPRIRRVSEHVEELRRIVATTAPAPPEMDGYLAKVRDRAWTIGDADVEALKDAGLSEDEIFEQTVAIAIAEGLRRLDAAEHAIR
jgi:hypothetical protein